MKLSEKWLSFCKYHIDKIMLRWQKDSGVSYSEWNELQSEYKKTFGKNYERKNQNDRSKIAN